MKEFKEIKKIFNGLKERYSLKSGFKDLLKIYSSDNRFYHNMHHVEDIINKINKDKDNYNSYELDALYLAAFYHDIVYDVRSIYNEDSSAAYFINDAESVIHDKEYSQVVINVQNIILSTKHHESKFYLANIFNYYDMSIIFSEWNDLVKWEDGIRKEYYIYPKDIYKAGRVHFLKSLLSSDKYLFTTEQRNNIMELIHIVSES